MKDAGFTAVVAATTSARRQLHARAAERVRGEDLRAPARTVTAPPGYVMALHRRPGGTLRLRRTSASWRSSAPRCRATAARARSAPTPRSRAARSRSFTPRCSDSEAPRVSNWTTSQGRTPATQPELLRTLADLAANIVVNAGTDLKPSCRAMTSTLVSVSVSADSAIRTHARADQLAAERGVAGGQLALQRAFARAQRPGGGGDGGVGHVGREYSRRRRCSGDTVGPWTAAARPAGSPPIRRGARARRAPPSDREQAGSTSGRRCS